MTETSSRGHHESRADFEALYDHHHRAVLAYTMRRTPSVQDAEDAAAETFAIAWRRLATRPDEPLPWLYAIARRVLANQRRASGQRARLLDRLRAQPTDATTPVVVGAGGPALDALRRLRPDDQELLRLVAWEGLDHGQIAVVLGVSVNAVTIRLHRARSRFTHALGQSTVKGSIPSRTYDMVKDRTIGPDRQEDTE